MKSSMAGFVGFVVLFCSLLGHAQQAPTNGQTANAAVPRLIKFSGMLLDEQRRPMAGPVGVTFALYAEQAGGAALWLETQNVHPDTDGNYTVLLGASSSHGVPMELFASGEARWLGVQAEREPEQPRVLLVSVPYALKAADAQTLGGLPPSAFVMAGSKNGLAAASGTPGSASGAVNGTGSGLPANADLTKKTVTTFGGTVNFAPKFTTATNIGNSAIFENGGNVGVGTTAPASKLQVVGNVTATQLISNVANGTPPLSVTSTTLVPNLNASLLGGLPASSFATLGANFFSANQTIAGNGTNILIGNVGCGSPTAGIGIGSVNCNTFGVGFDGAQNSTFIKIGRAHV